MSLSTALFYLLAACAGSSAVAVVLSRNLVRAAVGLLFTLLSLAGLYFLLGAEFLGAVQLMVYVGGTLVLVVFGIMMTNTGPTLGQRVSGIEWVLGGGLALGLLVALVAASLNLATPPAGAEPLPGIDKIGLSFLGVSEQTAYLLPFEIVSVHLLVVLVAAAYLARAKKRTPPPGPLPEAERGS